MEKKLTGYRFKPGFEKYDEAAKRIVRADSWGSVANYKKVQILPNGGYIDPMKEAGVLDLWFDPIYEEYKVGDWLYVKDSGCNIKEAYQGYVGQIAKIEENESPSGSYSHIYTFADGAKCSSREGYTRIATKEEIQKEEKIILAGHEVEFYKGGNVKVRIGCELIFRGEIEALDDLFGRNGFSLNVRVTDTQSGKSQEITHETVKKILKRLS